MDEGAWRATVHVVARVGHNLATKQRAISDEVVSVEPCPKATGARLWTKAIEAESRTKVTSEAD